MPVLVNHTTLVNAFEYAIVESRKDGIHVVDNLVAWRYNYSGSNRIAKLYGAVTHHVGSEVSAANVVSVAQGLASGSLIPAIGKVICNTTSIRSGVWPGSSGKPTIVVLAADYTNHAGLGDQGIMNELEDGDIDIYGEFKPSGDDLYLNRYFLGDEGMGAYTDASQQRAFVVFYSHVFWKLGLLVDVDKDGKFAPIVGHRETTSRKIDPSGANLLTMRRQMESFIRSRYLNVADPLVVTTFKNPYTPLTVDGKWGKKTTQALQFVLKEKYNAWGIGKPLVVDGIIGKNTYRALQRVLNQQLDISLVEDGYFGDPDERSLQRYVGATVDGVIGPNTIKKLQTKINGGF